jgi:hypothetical protein
MRVEDLHIVTSLAQHVRQVLFIYTSLIPFMQAVLLSIYRKLPKLCILYPTLNLCLSLLRTPFSAGINHRWPCRSLIPSIAVISSSVSPHQSNSKSDSILEGVTLLQTTAQPFFIPHGSDTCWAIFYSLGMLSKVTGLDGQIPGTNGLLCRCLERCSMFRSRWLASSRIC